MREEIKERGRRGGISYTRKHWRSKNLPISLQIGLLKILAEF